MIFKGNRFLEHGVLKLPLDSLAEQIKKHYHTARPVNDVRNHFATKVDELKRLCNITEADAIRALQAANKSHEISAVKAAPQSLLGTAASSVPASDKRTMFLNYGPSRKAVLDGSSLLEIGLDFARERKGAVVQSVEAGKPAAQSALVFEHDVVVKVNLDIGSIH